MKNEMMYAIGYRRLSGTNQSNYSLEYQEKTIQDYCKRYNLELLTIYTDNGQPSESFDRKDYKLLEEFIKQHKGQARYLIVMNHDRFCRHLPKALIKIDELEDKYAIKVLATHEDVNLDTKDPAVFINRSMHYMMAHSERLHINKRAKDGIRTAQTLGRYIYAAPFGYVKAKDCEKKVTLNIDSEKAAIVRMVFSEFLKNRSITEIYKQAKAMGYEPTGHSRIHSLLNNCLYAGLVRITGDKSNANHYKKGKHQPIISEQDFWLAKAKFEKKPSKTKPKLEFPLKGVLKCWCGKNMTAGYSKGKNKYYLYYRCAEHTSKNFNGDRLHTEFENLLEILSFSTEQTDYIIEQVGKQLKKANEQAKEMITARQEQIQLLIKKIDGVERKFMEDEIDGATYSKWKKNYMVEKAMLSKEIDDHMQNNKDTDVTLLQEILPKMKNMKVIYQNATLRKKHVLIDGVFKGNLTYSDGHFRTPYVSEMFQHNLLKAKQKGLFETNETPTKKKKIPLNIDYRF